jgi:hypothetical protein
LVSTISADKITIVVDMCFAGIFIPVLSGNNRIIITSTGSFSLMTTHSYKIMGETFFSKIFLDELDKGKSYGNAWEETDKKLDNPFFLYNIIWLEVPWIMTNPKIDDNGDRIGSGTFRMDKLDNLRDGDMAKNVYP